MGYMLLITIIRMKPEIFTGIVKNTVAKGH